MKVRAGGPQAERTAGADGSRSPGHRSRVSQATVAAAEPAPRPDQLNLLDEPTRAGKVTKAASRVQVGPGRVTQLRELPGRTFEDIFGDAA